MAKLSRILRCNQCGVVLQDSDLNKPGYIPSEVFKHSGERILYCDKCYQERMINASTVVSGINESIFHILEDAVASDALIVYVIDLSVFNGVIKSELIRKLKKVNFLVIANKQDLLPSNSNEDVIIDFIKERFLACGIKPNDVMVVSASKGYKMDELKQKMEELRKKHDIFMIGSKICGKTSIINKLLMNYENKTKRKIQVLDYNKTGIRVLSIPLDNSSNLYELPGFDLKDSILSIVERPLANKYIVPKKTLKAKKYKLAKDECLVIGGLGCICNKSEELFEFYTYFSDLIETKKVKEEKLDSYFKTNLIKRELRPVSERLQSFLNFDLFKYELDEDNNYHEIGIKGLGWISFKPKKQEIRILVPRGCGITEGKSRI